MNRVFPALLFFAFLPACVSAPEMAAYRAASQPSPVQADDFQTYESLHFTVKGHSLEKIMAAANWAEESYGRIMHDSNLFSFKPKENYRITVFRDQEEYWLKTGYPAWSGGGTITELLGGKIPSEREEKARTSIYTFEQIARPPLAHEITHLVFNEFMEFQTPLQSDRVLWLNEGLATYEEFEAYDKAERDDVLNLIGPLLKAHAMPLEDLVRFKPIGERRESVASYSYKGRTYIFTNIDLWYWQVRSLTEFLIKKQGEYRFFLLLNALKSGRDVMPAMEDAYPGHWRSFQELGNEWKESL